MTQYATVGPQWKMTEVDVSDNTVTVYAGPALIRAVRVTTALSAHACPISDGASGTNVGTLAASAAINAEILFHDMLLPNGIYVDPNDIATGKFIVIWCAMDESTNSTQPGPFPR